MSLSALKITGHTENYHWGKTGESSLIFKLIKDPQPKLPYAELWFGAHGRAPSPLHDSKYPDLRSAIKDKPVEMLGKSTSERFKSELPFLLKILSIARPLSLQLHPKGR